MYLRSWQATADRIARNLRLLPTGVYGQGWLRTWRRVDADHWQVMLDTDPVRPWKPAQWGVYVTLPIALMRERAAAVAMCVSSHHLTALHSLRVGEAHAINGVPFTKVRDGVTFDPSGCRKESLFHTPGWASNGTAGQALRTAGLST